MIISRAAETDLPLVRALLTRMSLPSAGVDEHFDSFLVARGDGDRVVGAIGLEVYAEIGLLRSLVIDDEWRSRGLGRDLVERLCDAARGRGVETLYLLTTTAETYFPRFGFEAIAREGAPPGLRASEEFRGACPASAVLMRLRL
jgi:amino-acid N-acetyltransferase